MEAGTAGTWRTKWLPMWASWINNTDAGQWSCACPHRSCLNDVHDLDSVLENLKSEKWSGIPFSPKVPFTDDESKTCEVMWLPQRYSAMEELWQQPKFLMSRSPHNSWWDHACIIILTLVPLNITMNIGFSNHSTMKSLNFYCFTVKLYKLHTWKEETSHRLGDVISTYIKANYKYLARTLFPN